MSNVASLSYKLIELSLEREGAVILKKVRPVVVQGPSMPSGVDFL